MPDEQHPKLFERLSPAEEQGRTAGGERLVQASYVAAGCHSASATAKATKPVNRKERRSFNEKIRAEEEIVLESWARQNQYWDESDTFLSRYNSRKIGEGSEAVVYLSYNDTTVIKVNDGAYHGNWLEFLTVLLSTTRYFLKRVIFYRDLPSGLDSLENSNWRL